VVNLGNLDERPSLSSSREKNKIRQLSARRKKKLAVKVEPITEEKDAEIKKSIVEVDKVDNLLENK
jgi:hypothetical protein